MASKYITGHETVRNIRCQCGWSMLVKAKSHQTTQKEHISARLHRKVCNKTTIDNFDETIIQDSKAISNVLDNVCGKERETIQELNIRREASLW